MKKLIFSIFVVGLGAFIAFSAMAQESQVRARVSSITPTQAVIYLDGWVKAERGESYTLYRNDGSNDVRLNVGTAMFWRDTVAIGKTYSYRLTKTPGGDVDTSQVNTTVRPGSIMKGVGWSVMENSGIGWISINSSSQEPSKGPHSATPYGIYADDSGEIHGAVWAGHGGGVGWGWLSFNRDDLEGCPDGNCSARVGSDGKINGWARFINAKETEDSWSGWVNLRSGNNYGLCFGDPDGSPIEIGGKAYYSGASCKGNGNTPHSVLTGAAWAGLNGGEPGGWIVFASSSAELINGTSTGANIRIQPEPPHKVAIRDIKKFWTNRNADWSIDSVKGGNLRYGTIAPSESSDGQLVDYLAPKTIPVPANTLITASTTEGAVPGTDSDPLTVIPPYSLACVPEGDTSMRLIITKNYTDPNYASRNPHRAELRGDTKTPPAPVIASSTNGNITSFVHTGLKEKQVYYYELATTFNDDGYLVRTPIVSCQTGVSPVAVLGVTSLNAYANTSRSIYVNWKDTSKATTAYEFEVQRMRITPDKDLRIVFNSTGATKVDLVWENKTTWTPYIQRILRSDNGGQTFAPVAGAVPYWQGENPPMGTLEYTFTDAVTMGAQYQYKIEVCSSLDLTDAYSAPMRGGTEKPAEVCVTSPVFNYVHSWSGGGEEEAGVPSGLTKMTASLLSVAQKTVRISWNAVSAVSEAVTKGFRAVVASLSEMISGDKGTVFAEEPTYDAYFAPVVITKNPSYRDDDLVPDTVYLYRVSVLAETPEWSDYRGAKTLKDNDGGIIENRPVCTRNSFCDGSITGVKSRDLSESSEQQCFANRDCSEVGRSDQGFQER